MTKKKVSSSQEVLRTWYPGRNLIYKYRHASSALKCLSERQVWFSKMKYLNDPDEGQYELSFERNFRGLHPVHHVTSSEMFDVHQMLMANAHDDFMNGVMYPVAYFCASRNPLEPLLWTHYAEGEHGVVIMFDGEHAPFAPEKPHSIDMRHDDKSPIPGHTMWRRNVAYQNDMPVSHLDTFPAESLLVASSTKASRWSYEEEVRVAWCMAARFDERGDKKGEAVPLADRSVAGIIFGRRCSGEDRNHLIEALRTNWPSARMFQVHASSYGGRLAMFELDAN